MKRTGLITATEAAQILGVSRQHVDRLIRNGQLPVVDIVGTQKIRLLDRRAILRFKKEREKKPKK